MCVRSRTRIQLLWSWIKSHGGRLSSTNQTFWTEDQFHVTLSSGIRNRDTRVSEIVVRELEKTIPDKKGGTRQLRGCSHCPQNGGPCTPCNCGCQTWTPSLRSCCFQFGRVPSIGEGSFQQPSQTLATRSVQDTQVWPLRNETRQWILMFPRPRW